ncbi:MAG: hypothetical protein WC525_10285 [Candidatus Thermoplasmatota archaeon]
MDDNQVVAMQLQDPNGNIIKEMNIPVVLGGDSIVVKFSTAQAWHGFLRLKEEERKKASDNFRQMFNPGGIVVIPPDIEIFVLHKELTAEG